MTEFNQGVNPTIACVNLATVALGMPFETLVHALGVYNSRYFSPIWGTPCKIVLAGPNNIPKDAWQILLLDDADQADALGYHDLTKDGLPVSKVFVKSTIKDGELVSVTASHELAEMLLDPACQLWAERNSGEDWAYEACDAVEETTFKVVGVPMSNFVHPAFFEDFHSEGSVKFDHLGLLKKPFSLLDGGYTIVSSGGKIKEVFGSKAKAERFAKESRRMHRSEYRKARG